MVTGGCGHRRPGCRGSRPASADATDRTSRLGCRHRRRHQSAVRGPDGFRWPARRVPIGASRPVPATAGPVGGAVQGRRRQTGATTCAADPRATHPAGEGHLQHLHRASTTGRDRKSTRLNSSHVAISYAVFCLKKKTKYKEINVSESIKNIRCIISMILYIIMMTKTIKRIEIKT